VNSRHLRKGLGEKGGAIGEFADEEAEQFSHLSPGWQV